MKKFLAVLLLSLVLFVENAGGGDTTHPAVLFVHGWNSDGASFGREANMLRAHGFLVLAPDFSDADTKDLNNVSREKIVSEVAAAYEQLARSPTVDPHRIVVVGTSLGAYSIATALTQVHPAQVVLHAPANYWDDKDAFADPHWLYEEIANPAAYQEIAAFRNTSHGPEATYSLRALAAAHVPVLIVRGSEDHTVPEPTVNDYRAAAGKYGSYRMITGAHHVLTPAEHAVLGQLILSWLSGSDTQVAAAP